MYKYRLKVGENFDVTGFSIQEMFVLTGFCDKNKIEYSHSIVVHGQEHECSR